MKDTNKLIKNILHAMPAIPYIAPKKTSLLPFILGGITVALVGGIAAVMYFSPRTRIRTVEFAKQGYGKLGLDHAPEHATTPTASNGLVDNKAGVAHAHTAGA